MKPSFLVASVLFLVGHAPLHAQAPKGEFIEVNGASAAVILVHGRGEGPDGQVVGALRHAIAKNAGMHTLSVQMPVLATSDYLAYAATYPDAYRTLGSAVAFLGDDKGMKRIYVLGYSMGARMSTAYLASESAPAVLGYVGVGVLEGGGDLLDANLNIAKLKIPVFDIYADRTPLDLASAEKRRSLVGERYKQARVQGANHSFRGYEGVLADEIMAWLKDRESKQ